MEYAPLLQSSRRVWTVLWDAEKNADMPINRGHTILRGNTHAGWFSLDGLHGLLVAPESFNFDSLLTIQLARNNAEREMLETYAFLMIIRWLWAEPLAVESFWTPVLIDLRLYRGTDHEEGYKNYGIRASESSFPMEVHFHYRPSRFCAYSKLFTHHKSTQYGVTYRTWGMWLSEILYRLRRRSLMDSLCLISEVSLRKRLILNAYFS